MARARCALNKGGLALGLALFWLVFRHTLGTASAAPAKSGLAFAYLG